MRTSIIIPANGIKGLENTLLAYKNQIYAFSFNTIVVNNGCNNDVTKISTDLGAKVIQLGKSPLSTAKNLGANQSESDIFIFNDQEFIPSRTYVESVQLSLLLNTDYGNPIIRNNSLLSIFSNFIKPKDNNIFVTCKAFYDVKGFPNLYQKLKQEGYNYKHLLD